MNIVTNLNDKLMEDNGKIKDCATTTKESISNSISKGSDVILYVL